MEIGHDIIQKHQADVQHAEAEARRDASILNPRPDRTQVEALLARLVDEKGCVDPAEARPFLSRLLDIGHDEIASDHDELLAFCAANPEERVEQILETASKEAIEEMHRQHFPKRGRLFRRDPDRDKVIAILEEIDIDDSATLGEDEAPPPRYKAEPTDRNTGV